MRKLIVVGDIHFKFIHGVDKGWQEDRYRKFIYELIEECTKKKATLVIAGDTLDSTTPKKEEVQMFLHLMHSLHDADITCLLVSGNHETLKVGHSILDYLEMDNFPNLYYRGVVDDAGVRFHLVNHDEISRYTPELGEGINVLISHFRSNYNKFVTEEIDVKKFTKPYDLCLVGDIHDSFEFDNVWYTNNPVNKEFDTDPKCGYLEVSYEGSSFDVKRVQTSYPSLRYRKYTAEEFIKSNFSAGQDFFKVEVEGTPEELRSVLPIQNCILHKIPIVPEVLSVKTETLEECKSSGGDGLMGYMKSLSYEDAYIADMMQELGRADD